MLRRSPVQRLARTVTSAAIVVAAATPSAQQSPPPPPPARPARAGGPPASGAADRSRARAEPLCQQGSCRPRPRIRLQARHGREGGDRRAVRQSQSGRDGLPEGDLSQQRRRHGHSGVSVPAAEEARRQRACRDGLGPRRRSRQLGRERCSRSSKRPSNAATSSSARSTAAARATARPITTRSTTAATRSTTR